VNGPARPLVPEQPREEDVPVVEKKVVRVGAAIKQAAVKRAILGEKGFMKLTANQRKSLRGFKVVDKEFHVHDPKGKIVVYDPKNKIVEVTLTNVGDIHEATFLK
jgi:hypothetical protein